MEADLIYMTHARKESYYFGSIGDGHHLYMDDPFWKIQSYKIKDIPGFFPWKIEHLDCGLLDNGKIPDHPTGKVYWTTGGDPLWYAFYWWDRTGDSRPESNSGFYVAGFKHFEAKEAFDFACSKFENIVKRQEHPLELQNA